MSSLSFANPFGSSTSKETLLKKIYDLENSTGITEEYAQKCGCETCKAFLNDLYKLIAEYNVGGILAPASIPSNPLVNISFKFPEPDEPEPYLSEEYNVERTLVLLKPDAFERGLVGEIMSIIDRKELDLVAAKQVHMTPDMVTKHYKNHVGKGFFPTLTEFMTSGPSLALVYEGKQACSAVRQLIGEKHPTNSPAGSIRGKYAMEYPRNLIHGSDHYEEADYEIGLYFTEEEIYGKEFKKKKKKEKDALEAVKQAAKEAKLAVGVKKGTYFPYAELFKKGQVIQYTPNGTNYLVTDVVEDGDTVSLYILNAALDPTKHKNKGTPLTYETDQFPTDQWKLIEHAPE